MKIFIDTAIIKEIEWAKERGLVDGVTTTPTLLSITDRKLSDVIQDILKLVKDGPVSIEVVSQNADEMVEEAKEISKLAKNVVIMVPMTDEGMIAVRQLSAKGIKTNVSLVYTVSQALLAARAGAAYVSPFIGNLDDVKSNGMELVEEIVKMYRKYEVPTDIIASSIRSTRHVEECALLGVDIVTVPFNILVKMYRHDLTDKGVKKFLEDWEKIPK